MRIDDVRRVSIVGAGRMGTEIALLCAVGGFDVVLHDVSDRQLESASQLQSNLLDEFVSEGRLSREEANAVSKRIQSSTDPNAAADSDLVNESVPENLKLKRELFGRLNQVCPPRTIFTSNTSYLRPSQMVSHVGRPERFAALHFHPPVWKSNVVDIMPHPGTAQEVVELLKQFSGRIGQIPILCRHEGEGFIFNTMLRTWLLTAITLADSGIGSIEDIDRSWMGVMLSKVGPFGILDNIGLDTVSDILKFWGMILRDPQAQKASAFLKPYVEAGKLGIKKMQGFYSYPNPDYLRPEFLAAEMFQSTAPDALIRRFIGFGTDRIAARSQSESSTDATSKRAANEPVTIATGENAWPAQPTSDAPERYVLRTLPATIPAKLKHAVRFSGPCLIAGLNADAVALKAKLEAAGATVTLLALDSDEVDLQRRLNDLWQNGVYPHLFLLSARDSAAYSPPEDAAWCQRFEQGVVASYHVCQRWYAEVMKRGIFETATVVGATAMGGDFGVSGSIDSAESGGVAGLLKAVYLEGAVRSSLGPQVKVVDSSRNQSPETTADQLMRELALAQASVVTGHRDESRRRYTEIEVGYPRGVRHQVYLEPVRAEPVIQRSEWSITPGSVWVVTGGAKGITAYVARELGKRYQLRMNLLGTTPLPNREASGETQSDSNRQRRGEEVQRELDSFAREGVHATYHACDVTDRAKLAETFERIRSEQGAIAGVIHGAGIEIGAKMPDKKPEDVRRTLAVKALGMSNLMSLTEHDPLQWFIAFGSLSGRFGNFAQTDYSMANELLAKQLAWMRAHRPECRCAVFHWPGWTDVGMAARTDGQEGLKRGHHNFLPPDQGLQHLLNEMAADSPQAEVVIVHPNEVPLEMRLARAAPGKKPTWQR